jgi:hypothetical protein
MAVNETLSAWEWTIRVFIPAIEEKTVYMVKAPIENRDTGLLWIIIPLMVTILFIEIYFARYKKEELGWNSAVSNSLVLIFVALDLFRKIYGAGSIDDGAFVNMTAETFIASVVSMIGIWFLYMSFFHVLPKRVAFKLGSPLPINVLAYLAIIMVYTDALSPPTGFNAMICVIAGFIIFMIFRIFFFIVHWMIPSAVEADMDDSPAEEKAKAQIAEIERYPSEPHRIPRPMNTQDYDEISRLVTIEQRRLNRRTLP